MPRRLNMNMHESHNLPQRPVFSPIEWSNLKLEQDRNKQEIARRVQLQQQQELAIQHQRLQQQQLVRPLVLDVLRRCPDARRSRMAEHAISRSHRKGSPCSKVASLDLSRSTSPSKTKHDSDSPAPPALPSLSQPSPLPAPRTHPPQSKA